MNKKKYENLIEINKYSNINNKKEIKALIYYTNEINNKDLANFYLNQLFEILAPETDKENEHENILNSIKFIETYLKINFSKYVKEYKTSQNKTVSNLIFPDIT